MINVLLLILAIITILFVICGVVATITEIDELWGINIVLLSIGAIIFFILMSIYIN